MLKYGYGVSLKALWPSSLEKQNVKLALQIFNMFVVEALSEPGPKHHLPNYQGSAEFITIISTWWKIMNVKSLNKGKRLHDQMQEPLTNHESDIKYDFLRKVLYWLDRWDEMQCDTGTLTRETLSAFKLTTHAIIELTNYCMSELGMTYILPGKFQTDLLEARFGQYRQLAGSQYHVSIRQIFEVEKKLRMSSVMTLSLTSKKCGNVVIDSVNDNVSWDTFHDSIDIEEFASAITVNDDDIANVENDLPIITYLSGYCAYCI